MPKLVSVHVRGFEASLQVPIPFDSYNPAYAPGADRACTLLVCEEQVVDRRLLSIENNRVIFKIDVHIHQYGRFKSSLAFKSDK